MPAPRLRQLKEAVDAKIFSRGGAAARRLQDLPLRPDVRTPRRGSCRHYRCSKGFRDIIEVSGRQLLRWYFVEVKKLLALLPADLLSELAT